MVSFIDYELPLRFDELFKSGSGQGKRRIQMTFQELREAIGSGQLDRRSYNLYVMEYHQRLVMPLACLLLGLLGAPVGASAPKANRMAGLTMSLFLFLAYYVGLTAGLGLGKNNLLHPVLAVWLPNAVTLVLAVVLWMRVQRERSIGLPGQGSAFPGRLRRGILSVVRKAARRPSRDPGVRP
jgi:lipopolysaccharide export system permease protein